MSTTLTLTEERQALRDQIWLSGPTHFDVSQLFTISNLYYDIPPAIIIRTAAGTDKEWTACFVGHQQLLCWVEGIFVPTLLAEGSFMPTLLDANNFRLCISIDGWREISIDGWCPGEQYDAYIAEGDNDRMAQWRTAVDWLDRLIKRGE